MERHQKVNLTALIKRVESGTSATRDSVTTAGNMAKPTTDRVETINEADKAVLEKLGKIGMRKRLVAIVEIMEVLGDCWRR
jgi:hypothetical protein